MINTDNYLASLLQVIGHQLKVAHAPCLCMHFKDTQQIRVNRWIILQPLNLFNSFRDIKVVGVGCQNKNIPPDLIAVVNLPRHPHTKIMHRRNPPPQQGLISRPRITSSYCERHPRDHSAGDGIALKF